MAISYLNSGSGTWSFASTGSFAFDAGSADDRVLIVFVAGDRGGATTISSATYNGVAMTAHTGFTSGATGFDGRLFYLAGPASGSNTVQVTLSDANIKGGILAIAYSGVDQTTPLENLTNVNPGSFGHPTATVSSETGDLVGFLCAHNFRASVTPTAPATERFDALTTAGVYMFAFDEDGAASVTIDGSFAGGTDEYWGTAFNMNAAAAASGVPKTNRMLMGIG